jgi:putative solute:sodium symporter small subunit
MNQDNGYWRANLKLMSVLLSIWFLVSFVFGIWIVDFLDQFHFFGFKLGFWFAQQGSIYIFVILIFVYVAQMSRLDKKFNVREEDE